MQTQTMTKNDLSLGEILPDEGIAIKLVVAGVEGDYELRDVTLRDFKWMQSVSGGSDLQKALEDVSLVAKFLYRLIKDKSTLKPIEVDDCDDDGNEIKVKLSGSDLVLDGMTLKNMETNTQVLSKLFGDALPITEQTKKPAMQNFKKKQ